MREKQSPPGTGPKSHNMLRADIPSQCGAADAAVIDRWTGCNAGGNF